MAGWRWRTSTTNKKIAKKSSSSNAFDVPKLHFACLVCVYNPSEHFVLTNPTSRCQHSSQFSKEVDKCPLFLNGSKYPLQQNPREQLRPRTLRAPINTIPAPPITPTSCITHNLLIKTPNSIFNRPSPPICNNTPPSPLPAGLNPQILRLERPLRIRSRHCVPNGQRVMELQALFALVALRVQFEVLFERGVQEERGPFYERGAGDRSCRGVRFEECGGEDVEFSDVCTK
jgi:hypothetical protein